MNPPQPRCRAAPPNHDTLDATPKPRAPGPPRTRRRTAPPDYGRQPKRKHETINAAPTVQAHRAQLRLTVAASHHRATATDATVTNRAPAPTRTRSCTAPPNRVQRLTFGRETINATRPIHRHPGPASTQSGNALPTSSRQLTQRRDAIETTPTVHMHRAQPGLKAAPHYRATTSNTRCHEALDMTATIHARRHLPGLEAAPHYQATTADLHKDVTPLRQHRQSASDGPTTAATLLRAASSRPRTYTNALAPLRAHARPPRAGSTRDAKTCHAIGARPPALTQSRHC
jgi:hypothetical protein